jgi:EpsG family
MEHHPEFFLAILFIGIGISFLPCINWHYYEGTKVFLCSCVFPFYWFAGRGANDLPVYQSILDSISNSSIESISQDASQPFEILSLISLWLFRIFDKGAYLWHASIVVFLFVSIIFFIESVVGKKPLIPAISFVLVLPSLLGECIINQSRQLLATSILIICLSCCVKRISIVTPLLYIFLIVCAGLSHYSSALMSITILPLIFFQFFLNTKRLFGKIFLLIAATFLLSLSLYLAYPFILSIAAPSLDFSMNKYSAYQSAANTYTFAVESVNARLIQCLFLFDFMRILLTNKNHSLNQSSNNTSSKIINIYLYVIGFMIYIFSFWAVYTPEMMELGRRTLYYGLIIQALSFSISLSKLRRIKNFFLLTIPFTLYSIIMIISKQDISSGYSYFVF